MPRLKTIEPDQATGNAKVLLDAVNERYGMVPNLARTLANLPAALPGDLAFSEALDGGELPARLREQIALIPKLTSQPFLTSPQREVERFREITETYAERPGIDGGVDAGEDGTYHGTKEVAAGAAA